MYSSITSCYCIYAFSYQVVGLTTFNHPWLKKPYPFFFKEKNLFFSSSQEGKKYIINLMNLFFPQSTLNTNGCIQYINLVVLYIPHKETKINSKLCYLKMFWRTKPFVNVGSCCLFGRCLKSLLSHWIAYAMVWLNVEAFNNVSNKSFTSPCNPNWN